MTTWDIAPRCVCCSCCIDGREARRLQFYQRNGAMADEKLSIGSQIPRPRDDRRTLLRIENICKVESARIEASSKVSQVDSPSPNGFVDICLTLVG